MSFSSFIIATKSDDENVNDNVSGNENDNDAYNNDDHVPQMAKLIDFMAMAMNDERTMDGWMGKAFKLASSSGLSFRFHYTSDSALICCLFHMIIIVSHHCRRCYCEVCSCFFFELFVCFYFILRLLLY